MTETNEQWAKREVGVLHLLQSVTQMLNFNWIQFEKKEKVYSCGLKKKKKEHESLSYETC